MERCGAGLLFYCQLTTHSVRFYYINGVQYKLMVSESMYTVMVTRVAPKQRQENRLHKIREEMGGGGGGLRSIYTSSSDSPSDSPSDSSANSPSDSYVGGWLCWRSPKITTHSSCGNAGKASAVAARDPASMVLNSVPRRGLHTARS